MLEIPASYLVTASKSATVGGKRPAVGADFLIGTQEVWSRTAGLVSPPAENPWDARVVETLDDWGPISEADKLSLKKILTSKVRGKVLEAMCGFRSNIFDCPGIDQVVALDFSSEALERYDYPQRTRVLYDLNKIRFGAEVPFFPKGYFDSVCITFGVNYLDDPYYAFKEFARITGEQGKLLIVGNPELRIRDLERARFDPERTAISCEFAGFRNTRVSWLPIERDRSRGTYYLIEAAKAA